VYSVLKYKYDGLFLTIDPLNWKKQEDNYIAANVLNADPKTQEEVRISPQFHTNDW
jgi:hypothetical protein